MRSTLFFSLAVSCALVFGASIAFADNYSSTNYTDLSPVVGAGGYSTSTSYTLSSVIGSVAFGTSSSASYGDNAGFLYYPYVTTPVITATAGTGQVSLSWTTARGYLGWTPSTYSYGVSTVSGGPYTYTSAGSSLSATISSLSNGTTYYFVVRVQDALGNSIATSSEASATPFSSSGSSGATGGSGGGGNGPVSSVSAASSTATVVISGRAYPNSTVTILEDAQVVSSVNADSNAAFQTTITGLTGGSYIFSLYGEDDAGNRSGLLTFPVSLVAGATTDITGVFIAPTISTDLQTVKQGDTIAIFGSSAPSSTVTIVVHSSNELFLQAQSDASGAYLYNLDTSPLELGSHSAISKAATNGEISAFGDAVSFQVGDQNVTRVSTSTCSVYDLNCDGKINLIDFSILVYWYKRPLTGKGLLADFNHDGRVDLVDFSILVSHWTG